MKLMTKILGNNFLIPNPHKLLVKTTGCLTTLFVLCACQSLTPKQTSYRDSTLFLTKNGIIEKNIVPTKNVNITLANTDLLQTQDTQRKHQTSALNGVKPKQYNKTIEPKRVYTTPQSNRQIIDLGNQNARGYSSLQIYTEIPVPTQYSPARVISYNGQTTLIPATPTRIERVRVGPNTQIRGFIDYGPTINVPVRTRQGVRYIQQKSPMPMPIIDSISVTYE